MTLQPVTPVIVKVVGAPTKELGVVDVLVQSLGLTALLLLGSVLFGVALAVVFIWYRRRNPDNALNGEAAGRYKFDLNSPDGHSPGQRD
jgi:hypothetical protein